MKTTAPGCPLFPYPVIIRFVADGDPLTANHAYEPAVWHTKHGIRHGFRKNDKAELYRNRLQYGARRAMLGARPLEGSLQIEIWFYFSSHRPDIDGPIKLALDAPQRIAYKNDRQCKRLIVNYEVDPKRPRTEMEIVEISPNQISDPWAKPDPLPAGKDLEQGPA